MKKNFFLNSDGKDVSKAEYEFFQQNHPTSCKQIRWNKFSFRKKTLNSECVEIRKFLGSLNFLLKAFQDN